MIKVFKVNCSDEPLPYGTYEIDQINSILKNGSGSPQILLESVFLLHLSAYVDRKGAGIESINFLGKKLSEEIIESEVGKPTHLSIDGSRDNEAVSAAIVSGMTVALLTGKATLGFESVLTYLMQHFGGELSTKVFALTLAKILRQFGRYNEYFTVITEDTSSFDVILESTLFTSSPYLQFSYEFADLVHLFQTVGIENEITCIVCGVTEVPGTTRQPSLFCYYCEELK